MVQLFDPVATARTITETVYNALRGLPGIPEKAEVFRRVMPMVQDILNSATATMNLYLTGFNKPAAVQTGNYYDEASVRKQEQAAALVRLNAAVAAQAASDATAQASAVAAARISERAICAAEINVAPVSGITLALTLFSASERAQIHDYVASGPH